MNYKQLSDKNLCVSIANKSFDECIEIAKKSKLLELRLDKLNLFDKELKELFNLETKYIITHRLGEWLNDQSSGYLKNIIDLGADFVDIEIEQGNEFVDDLIDYAHNHNTKVILSYHNFNQTPNIGNLQLIIDNAKSKNPDYVKIATQVFTKKDVSRLLSLYENNDKLIAFGMGEVGRISRIACLYLGADFTYVAPDKENKTAQGQLLFDEAKKLLEII